MPRHIAGYAATAALQVVALVLAHDLVYLTRYGSRYGEALAHAGHGETWSTTVGATFAIATALLVAGIARLVYLAMVVRGAHAAPARGLDIGRLARLWLRIGPRFALVSVVLLTVQENLERSAVGGSVPGAAILLSPEYPAAAWITVAVGLFVGLVKALFDWRREALLQRLRVARAALPRLASPAALRPRGVASRPVISVLGRRSGLRAPPVGSLA